MSTRPRGRRSGADGGTRDSIVAAALAEFSASGYDAASMRGVARGAGVDPSLVRYYFPGGKAELFATAMANRDVAPAQVIGRAVAGGPDGMGERLLLQVLGVWDSPEGRDRFRLVLGAVASGGNPMFRDFLTREVLTRVQAVTPGPDGDLRAALVISQIAGVLVTRYVLAIEPLASEPVESVARRLGPALDAVLAGTLAPSPPEEHNSSHGE